MTKTAPIKPKNSKESVVLTEAQIKQQISEIALKEEHRVKVVQESLSWVGKMFFAGLAGALASTATQAAGIRLPFKLRGSPAQIKSIVDAVMATKEFQEEIKRPGATVETVIRKLNLKNITKGRFEQLTGREWPL